MELKGGEPDVRGLTTKPLSASAFSAFSAVMLLSASLPHPTSSIQFHSMSSPLTFSEQTRSATPSV
jgi:hypothetical protein